MIFFFHNNPKEIRGSKTIKERLNILEHTDKVFFVSAWTKKVSSKICPIKLNQIVKYYIHQLKKQKFNKKKKKIIFTGKLNSSKGYDLFGEAIIKILNKYSQWNAVVAGNEPREKYYFNHKNLKIYPWLPQKKF